MISAYLENPEQMKLLLDEHDLQKQRQGYLSQLQEHISVKIDELKQEADDGVESEQTFQRWIAEQIVKSADYLS